MLENNMIFIYDIIHEFFNTCCDCLIYYLLEYSSLEILEKEGYNLIPVYVSGVLTKCNKGLCE